MKHKPQPQPTQLAAAPLWAQGCLVGALTLGVLWGLPALSRPAPVVSDAQLASSPEVAYELGRLAGLFICKATVDQPPARSQGRAIERGMASLMTDPTTRQYGGIVSAIGNQGPQNPARLAFFRGVDYPLNRTCPEFFRLPTRP